MYGPAARRHGHGNEEYVVEEGQVSEWSYAPCAAGDFPRGDDGRLSDVDHDPCSARLSLFFSRYSFLEMLVWGT